jgi:uncharacterized protein YrrD
MAAIQKASNHTLIASDRIEGTLVRRYNGEKIGKIERLMIEKASGTIAYAVMSFGGLWTGRQLVPNPVVIAQVQPIT